MATVNGFDLEEKSRDPKDNAAFDALVIARDVCETAHEGSVTFHDVILAAILLKICDLEENLSETMSDVQTSLAAMQEDDSAD